MDNKLAFDKYYTPPIVARWCIDKVKEIIGEENITEWIEPSAGSGSFSHQIKGCKAYDLYPQHEYIEQHDFLTLPLEYKKGRIFIGNPPFGSSTKKLLRDFYNKCTEYGDYIAFILPSSFASNYSTFYKFEIVYSCLIEADYTNKKLWTAFVIYKRNPDKNDWREKEEKLQDVTFTKYSRARQDNKKVLDYDYAFSSFGVVMKETQPYKNAGVIAIKCNNPKNKEEIINFFKWLYHYNKESKVLTKKCISSPGIDVNTLIRLLKICIKGIK